jgi:predicted nucleic acid-binding Zn ribbon protein
VSFVSLRKALENVLLEYHIAGDIDAYKVFHLWEDIVGGRTAHHTKPIRINQSILYVEVDDPLWLSQLRYMKLDIMDKIDRMIKKGVLKDLKFYLKTN